MDKNVCTEVCKLSMSKVHFTSPVFSLKKGTSELGKINWNSLHKHCQIKKYLNLETEMITVFVVFLFCFVLKLLKQGTFKDRQCNIRSIINYTFSPSACL